MIGQPASPVDEVTFSTKIVSNSGDESADLNAEIGQLNSTLGTTNPLDIIMNEKLDEDGGLLMDGMILACVLFSVVDIRYYFDSARYGRTQ